MRLHVEPSGESARCMIVPTFKVDEVVGEADLHMVDACRATMATLRFDATALPVDDLTFTARPDGVVLVVDILVPNRDEPSKLEWIHIWRTLLCPWGVLRSNGPEYLVRWMRETVVNTLAHEVDESITLEGERVFDPHRPLRTGSP